MGVALVTERGQGAASLAPGSLELMVHRRSTVSLDCFLFGMGDGFCVWALWGLRAF